MPLAATVRLSSLARYLRIRFLDTGEFRLRIIDSRAARGMRVFSFFGISRRAPRAIPAFGADPGASPIPALPAPLARLATTLLHPALGVTLLDVIVAVASMDDAVRRDASRYAANPPSISAKHTKHCIMNAACCTVRSGKYRRAICALQNVFPLSTVRCFDDTQLPG